MLRTLNTAERNIQSLPPNVITLAANTATLLLPDTRNVPGEIAYRRIQNVGGADLYVSIGVTTAAGAPMCDNVAVFHKVLISGQEMDCSADRQIICGFSVGGTTVATEVKQRLTL